MSSYFDRQFSPRHAAALTASCVAFLAGPAPAAEAALPVGEADGVRIERRPHQGSPHGRRELVVAFTKRAAGLYRKIAGRVISVYCTELVVGFEDAGGPLGLTSSSSGGGSVRAPKNRRPIHTGDLTRGLDYCRVWLAKRTVGRGRKKRTYGRELIVSVPLTQEGAVHLDEESKTFELFKVLLAASELAARRDSTEFPTAAELVVAIGDSGGPARHPVVPLVTPDDTPAADTIGYYSDGREHVAAVILSASGRRLLIEYEPGGVLRTNVAGYLYGDLD